MDVGGKGTKNGSRDEPLASGLRTAGAWGKRGEEGRTKVDELGGLDDALRGSGQRKDRLMRWLWAVLECRVLQR